MAIQNAGRHDIVERLGSGNFATVYEAVDPALDSSVAVKILADHHASDPDTRERFIREGRLLRKVASDRVVAVHDIGELSDGRPYLIMELATGGTLRDAMARREAVDRQDIRRVIAELTDCMKALHGAGLVHRDLKPSNVLIRGRRTDDDHFLSPDQQLVLGDFGLAREAAASSLTVAAGSDGYMAPEQRAADGVPDERADLFSASAIVYELLAGRPPRQIVTSTPLTASELGGLPETARGALLKALDPDPDRRFENAAAWGAALLEGLPPDSVATDQVSRVTTTSPPRSRAAWALAVAAAILLVGVIWVATRSSGPMIIGPDVIEVGAVEVFTAETRDGASYFWTDWNGQRHFAPGFEITATSPGRLTFTLTEVDAAGNTATSDKEIQVVATDSAARLVRP